MTLISIIICTYNKSKVLKVLLERLLLIKEEDFEIIVVNNNSKDDTASLCDDYLKISLSHNIKFKYLNETKVGLSYARNSGSQIAKGKYLLFLDDDCIPETNIINEYKKAIMLFPNLGIAGGKIVPRWINNIHPNWLPHKYNWIYGELVLDNTNCPRKIKRNETLNGGNFVICKDLLKELGGFNTTIGNAGSKESGGEEYDMILKAMKIKDVPIVWVPKACVIHEFPIERLNIEYARKRIFNSNYDRAVVEYKSMSLRSIAKIVFYILRYYFPGNQLTKYQLKGYLKAMYILIINTKLRNSLG